tara:strand:- start:5561 stop:5974 length:414 start_codon:yes stop_codon:yes gene_type:complete
MNKKNLFDLLALKEKISSSKYIQKLRPLNDEKLKIMNILEQLNVLKENKNTTISMSAWELKSASNIQEKIFDQIAIAETRMKNIKIEISVLEKKFIEHEIRKKRAFDKSLSINKEKKLENDKKLDDELQTYSKVKFT